jgi:DNA (cytosine-5)-methyltransferase 1
MAFKSANYVPMLVMAKKRTSQKLVSLDPVPAPTKYKFIDLFAGIGGFHVALAKNGRGECVFASEWDPSARKTYEHFFRESDPHLFANNHRCFAWDINKVELDKEFVAGTPNHGIPDFDVLCGGFPCQPFSHAGHGKGFADTRGTLFFTIQQIIEAKKPRAFFLENVRGLLTHGGPSEIDPKNVGKTMETILERLFSNKKGCLGYHRPKGTKGYILVRASDYGVPQHRPRVFIIGFRDEKDAENFDKPSVQILPPEKLGDILNNHDVFYDEKCTKPRKIGFTLRCGGKGSPIEDRRNWEHYYVRPRGSKKRLKAKVIKIDEQQGLQLHGFPEAYKFPEGGPFKVGRAARMKQLGNSVAVTAVQAWAESIFKALDG